MVTIIALVIMWNMAKSSGVEIPLDLLVICGVLSLIVEGILYAMFLSVPNSE